VATQAQLIKKHGEELQVEKSKALACCLVIVGCAIAPIQANEVVIHSDLGHGRLSQRTITPAEVGKSAKPRVASKHYRYKRFAASQRHGKVRLASAFDSIAIIESSPAPAPTFRSGNTGAATRVDWSSLNQTSAWTAGADTSNYTLNYVVNTSNPVIDATEKNNAGITIVSAPQVFSIKPGQAVSEPLGEFVQATGWQLSWDADEYVVSTSVTLKGTLEEVTDALIRALNHSGARLKSVLYSGNKTLRISERN